MSLSCEVITLILRLFGKKSLYIAVINLSHYLLFLLVGPGVKVEEEETFDQHCIFTNLVKMFADQASLLRDHVEATEKPVIPYYVCTMRKSHVESPRPMMVNTILYLFLSTTSKSASYNL